MLSFVLLGFGAGDDYFGAFLLETKGRVPELQLFVEVFGQDEDVAA
jgi:hypothetical protein